MGWQPGDLTSGQDDSRGQPDDFWHGFGQRLLASGHLTDSKLARAKASTGRKTGETLATALVKLGLCSEEAVGQALADELGLAFVRIADAPDLSGDLAKIRTQFLLDEDVVPLGLREDRIVLAMADPLDDEAAAAIAFKTGRKLIRVVATRADVRASLAKVLPVSSLGRLDDADPAGADQDVERLIDLARGAPVIRWVEDVLAMAVDARASDIHLEPERDHVRLRLRIDGVLVPIQLPIEGTPEAVVSRIKILAKLNIAERRLPQDGRIRTAVRGREIDLRVATMPSLHGETVVMRLLDQSAAHLELDALGFSELARIRLVDAITQPHGITLVTGPTGSGKTTTLYAALRHLMSPELKFISVEDPVEYEIVGVSQVQVKADIGFTFARALRSVVRHDPNVLMIGEIRDLESASIAVEAALTGHTVLSTVHTNNAPSTITRLVEMGVEDYLLASTVNAIAAQRLVRVLCTACKTAFRPSPAIEARLVTCVPSGHTADWQAAQGCASCRGTGYRGRVSVGEVMPVTAAIQSAILKRLPESDIRQIATDEGMISLFDEGVRLAAAGVTSLQEVFAVIGSRAP